MQANINFYDIIEENKQLELYNSFCFLKTHLLKSKDENQKNKITENITKINEIIYQELLKHENLTKTNNSVNSENTIQLVYHKLWNKLTRFHKENKIKEYIDNLNNCSQQNKNSLLKEVMDEIDEKKYLAMHSMIRIETVNKKKRYFYIDPEHDDNEFVMKKNKNYIDYDPIKGVIVNISNISYNDELKKYEIEK
jgi:hypothetical protein